MKKFLLLIAMIPIIGFAESVEIDGIKYNLIEKGKIAEVIGAYKANITIPSFINYNYVDYKVSSIGESAFIGSGIESIIIGNEVKSIGTLAFAGCRNLSSVEFGENVEKIGQVVFEHCINLKKVNLPKSVSSINGAIFIDCTNLESIVVESENKVFDSRDNCNAIIETEKNKLINGCKNTIIPSSVVSIGPDAFRDCDGLKSIEIPYNVELVENLAFYRCEKLSKVFIRGNVKVIKAFAFEGCTGLEDFYCYAKEVPSVEKNIFKDSYIEYSTLHVPSESVEKYKNDLVFGKFGKIVAISDSETGINFHEIKENALGNEMTIYTIDGKKHKKIQKGLNIIKANDGKTNKVFVK